MLYQLNVEFGPLIERGRRVRYDKSSCGDHAPLNPQIEPKQHTVTPRLCQTESKMFRVQLVGERSSLVLVLDITETM